MSTHPARLAQEALFAAYISATGFVSLTLSHSRRFDLQAMVEMGLTAGEVTAVIRNIQRKIARSEGGFTETSLLWRNAMKPSNMEENVLLYRQAKGRAKGARPQPVAARTDALPDGSTVSRLDTAVPRDPAAKSLKEMVADAMKGEHEFRRA